MARAVQHQTKLLHFSQETITLPLVPAGVAVGSQIDTPIYSPTILGSGDGHWTSSAIESVVLSIVPSLLINNRKINERQLAAGVPYCMLTLPQSSEKWNTNQIYLDKPTFATNI